MEEGGRTEELPVQWRAHFEHFFIHLQAYLPYGIPRLMQKVVYTVGGHLFSAVFIEYVILKMKSPSHRPQMVFLSLVQGSASHPPEDQDYENYYPKGKKEVPKGDCTNKSESK
ncbi:hypothetical protein ACJX0J_034452, partial [Zea mays]